MQTRLPLGEAPPPLADRMRPLNLDEFLGQTRILGPQSLLRASLERDSLPSMIFWGPPGCGKTSLAQVVRTNSRKRFIAISAVSSGIKEVKEVLAQARIDRRGSGAGTILFIDEIHRFNKAQQDALLQAVEEGVVVLIGATTENPSFEVNNALLSRCQLVLFAPLTEGELRQLLEAALHTHPRGLLRAELQFSEEVVARIVSQADGDARFLLNQVEWVVQALPAGITQVNSALLEQLQYHKPLRYDKSGEDHYNLISVLHKSVRGSDPDGAVYWLHRMLAGGEDPRYLLRRLMRMAMEDVGLADPHAITLAASCRAAYDFLGVPEGLIALDQLVIYLALAPKSNSVEKAGQQAEALVRERGTLPVPRAFRNAVNRTGRQLGYGSGYAYDHDHPHAYAGQEHLPDALRGTHLYQPTQEGDEVRLARRLEFLESLRTLRSDAQSPHSD